MAYEIEIECLKALADENRIQIIKMLRVEELCACKLLETLSITQPTLSHHMRVLCNANLITCRKEGKWQHYSLNKIEYQKVANFILDLASVRLIGEFRE